MSPLGLALSLLIGVSLGFFGGGGSILTVPLLVYVFGLDPKTAIASSLLVVGAASTSGAIHHWRVGNVDLRTGLLFGAAGMTGAYLGGRVGAFLDGTLLLLLFACMMVLTSVAMWQGRRARSSGASARRATGRLVLQGLAVGSFTGLVGAGGGFLIVPALTLWAGLSMHVAVGTSLFIIVLNTMAGFLGYLNHVQVDFALIGAVTAMAIAGSFAGSALATRINPASLRRAFAVFVLAMATFILVREVDLWIATAQEALPGTTPQIVFAVLMLAVGIAAGRVTRRAAREPLADRLFTDGGGI
ncbi:MAG: sulfite exporter TauE/SafE family protein [Polyangiales bacterium]